MLKNIIVLCENQRTHLDRSWFEAWLRVLSWQVAHGSAEVGSLAVGGSELLARVLTIHGAHALAGEFAWS